jgi:hypothetical protein
MMAALLILAPIIFVVRGIQELKLLKRRKDSMLPEALMAPFSFLPSVVAIAILRENGRITATIIMMMVAFILYQASTAFIFWAFAVSYSQKRALNDWIPAIAMAAGAWIGLVLGGLAGGLVGDALNRSNIAF